MVKRKIVFAVIGTLAALSAVAVTGGGQQAGFHINAPAGDHESLNPGT